MKKFRVYGNQPYSVAVLHGGPGYPGSVAAVARELSSEYGVLEPLQSAGTVDGQVEELAGVLRENAGLPAILVGWSWGSTLALITAARYPGLVGKLILVCGASLQQQYRDTVFSEKLNRMTEEERKEVFALQDIAYGDTPGDKAKAMARLFTILIKADSYDLLPYTDDVIEYQVDISKSVGGESHAMYRDSGFIDSLAGIKCPVVAICGDYDTRPPEGIAKPLSDVLEDFRLVILEKCGHMPWCERYAGAEFYRILRKEIEDGFSRD